MEIRGKDLKAGMKVKAGKGYRIMDEVTDRGDYVWTQYREFDRDGTKTGSYGEMFWKTDHFVKL